VTELIVPGRRWFEMLATGNTRVEGRSITVEAPRIGYTSDKEVLTIEGEGRVLARGWMQSAPGRERDVFEGQKLQYNVRTGAAATDGVKNIRIHLDPDMKLPFPSSFNLGGPKP
jgi:lipopolysaccharide export system protein LptA